MEWSDEPDPLATDSESDEEPVPLTTDKVTITVIYPTMPCNRFLCLLPKAIYCYIITVFISNMFNH